MFKARDASAKRRNKGRRDLSVSLFVCLSFFLLVESSHGIVCASLSFFRPLCDSGAVVPAFFPAQDAYWSCSRRMLDRHGFFLFSLYFSFGLSAAKGQRPTGKSEKENTSDRQKIKRPILVSALAFALSFLLFFSLFLLVDLLGAACGFLA